MIGQQWGDNSTFPWLRGLRRLNKRIDVAQDKNTWRTILGLVKSGTQSALCFNIIFTNNIIAVDLEINQFPRRVLEQPSLASNKCIPNR